MPGGSEKGLSHLLRGELRVASVSQNALTSLLLMGLHSVPRPWGSATVQPGALLLGSPGLGPQRHAACRSAEASPAAAPSAVPRSETSPHMPPRLCVSCPSSGTPLPLRTSVPGPVPVLAQCAPPRLVTW